MTWMIVIAAAATGLWLGLRASRKPPTNRKRSYMRAPRARAERWGHDEPSLLSQMRPSSSQPESVRTVKREQPAPALNEAPDAEQRDGLVMTAAAQDAIHTTTPEPDMTTEASAPAPTPSSVTRVILEDDFQPDPSTPRGASASAQQAPTPSGHPRQASDAGEGVSAPRRATRTTHAPTQAAHKAPLLGITVVAKHASGFSGKALKQWFETHRLQYGSKGLFWGYRNNNHNGQCIFQVLSLVEPGYFVSQDMPHTQYPGVAFVLLGEGTDAADYEDMIQVAEHLASAMAGQLCDLARQPMTRSDLELKQAQTTDAEA